MYWSENVLVQSDWKKVMIHQWMEGGTRLVQTAAQYVFAKITPLKCWLNIQKPSIIQQSVEKSRVYIYNHKYNIYIIIYNIYILYIYMYNYIYIYKLRYKYKWLENPWFPCDGSISVLENPIMKRVDQHPAVVPIPCFFLDASW